jgi:hypothetical protein
VCGCRNRCRLSAETYFRGVDRLADVVMNGRIKSGKEDFDQPEGGQVEPFSSSRLCRGSGSAAAARYLAAWI